MVEPQCAARPSGKFQAWAAYDYSHIDMQAGPDNGSGTSNTVAVGGDMKVSDRMLVGAMFGYTDNKGDFGGAGGGYKLKAADGTVYAGYGDGPVVRRRDAWRRRPRLLATSTAPSRLGALNRTESGEARGYELHRPAPRRLLVHDAAT